MARVCESCGKKTIFGRNVSHAHNVTPRRFEPNLQRVRIREASGGSRRAVLCTRCIRTGGFRKRVS